MKYLFFLFIYIYILIYFYKAGFLITWTPYAILGLSRVISNFELEPIYYILAAFFGKSSILWTTLIYIMTNRIILNKYMGLFFQE